jgi:hypothetical protein
MRTHLLDGLPFLLAPSCLVTWIAALFLAAQPAFAKRSELGAYLGDVDNTTRPFI